MDDSIIAVFLLFLVLVILSALVLPIVALVITVRSRRRLGEQIAKLQATPLDAQAVQELRTSDLSPLARAVQLLSARVDKLETALRTGSIPVAEVSHLPEEPAVVQPTLPVAPPPTSSVPPVPIPGIPITAPPETPPPKPPLFSPGSPHSSMQAERLESIIGRRWVGWAAVAIIILAAGFFLKYAFDNRWIGELGRVAIGVTAGISVTVVGYRYYLRGWRIFSQILTACGIVLLYLSVYAAFGYYHLATQKVAFTFLTVLIAEAGILAILYEAPAIAIMALIGGFLAPVLLRSDRDQYRSLFGYIALLDVGALALLRHWPGLSSLAFAGTHFLFWLWFAEHYHPRKRFAVLVFQTAVLLIFVITHVARRLLTRQRPTLEDLSLLLINPFVFFITAYSLLNGDHHDWMGVFAIGMALLYAGQAKILLERSKAPRNEILALIGIALTFVTLAIPIQLKSNWITIAWSVEALTMLWVGLETKTRRLQEISLGLFVLALGKLVFWDTPWLGLRPLFTPIFNKYCLSSLLVIGCLFAAGALCRKFSKETDTQGRTFALAFMVAGIAVLWFVLSIETYTFFQARAATQELIEDFEHERWLGQMALSVVWSVYAATLAAVGFVRRSAVIRWTALGLFALTTIKVMLVDIAALQKLYRIIAFLVLGILLLLVAWGYHKAFHSRESTK